MDNEPSQDEKAQGSQSAPDAPKSPAPDLSWIPPDKPVTDNVTPEPQKQNNDWIPKDSDLSKSYAAVKDSNPDENAQNVVNAKKLGIKPEDAAANPEGAKKTASGLTTDDIAKLEKDHPEIAKAFADHPELLAQTHDDVPS